MIGDKLFTFKQQINETFFATLKQAMGSLNKFFEENSDSTQRLAITIGKTLSVAVSGLGKMFKSLKDNADTVLTVFASIISLKIARIFFGVATAINGMTVAMTGFNLATKKNLIFGAIAVFTAAVVLLTKKFKDFKNAITDLNPTSGAEALLKVKDAQLERDKAIAHLAEQSGGHALRTAKERLKLREEELKIAQEQLIVFSRIDFAKNRPNQRDIAGFKPDRKEVTKGKDLEGIIQANKGELDLLIEKNIKEKAIVDEQLAKLHQAKANAVLGRGRELSEEELALKEELIQTHLLMEDNFQKQVTAIYKSEADKRAAIEKQNLDNFKAGKFSEVDFAKMSNKDKLSGTMHHLRETLSETAKHSKKAFRLQKALNIAEAVMNTATGVAEAMKLPFPFNVVVAGLKMATGMAQVQTIRNQQPPAQFGGSRLPNSPFLVGEKGPELFTPNTAGSVTPNHQIGGGGATVNFNITTVDAQSFGTLLDTRRGQIVNMINSALNNKGQAALV